MTFLSQAFALAGRCHHAIGHSLTQIHDTYDRVGCFIWRAMMDDHFLAIEASTHDSKAYRETAVLYDWGKKRAASWVYETLSEKGASGDVGPKPDIKPGLINVAQASMPYITRVNWSSPLIIGAMCLTTAFSIYAFAHMNGMHGSAVDTIGTIYGSKPSLPQPAHD